jgi:hypothetical protein
MPLAGLVLNRVHTGPAEGLSAERALTAAEDLQDAAEHPVTAGLLRIHADRMRLSEREKAVASRFVQAHPTVAVARVPARPQDVHDLEGLRGVGADLAASGEPAYSG